MQCSVEDLNAQYRMSFYELANVKIDFLQPSDGRCFLRIAIVIDSLLFSGLPGLELSLQCAN